MLINEQESFILVKGKNMDNILKIPQVTREEGSRTWEVIYKICKVE